MSMGRRAREIMVKADGMGVKVEAEFKMAI